MSSVGALPSRIHGLGDRRRLVARVLAGAGFAIAAVILISVPITGRDGVGGVDALAFWGAGRAVLEGRSPYGPEPGQTAAFLYTPLAAQALAPFSLLPSIVFVWLWRAFEVVCLRVALGSWTRAGLSLLLFPPVIVELLYGNVNLAIAAVCALAMRGRVAAVPVPIVVKLAALPLLPLALLRAPRMLAIALVAGGVAALVSYLAAPDLWRAFLDLIRTAPEPTWWTNLSRGIPLALRLAVAGVLAVLEIRWVRLAPIATVIGLPIVWLTTLSVLVAVAAPLPAARDGTAAPPAG